MNDFLKAHQDEIRLILDKYPGKQKRSAVMPLLHLAQKNKGYINHKEIDAISQLLGISQTEVASIIGFYTLYHPEQEGARIRIQVCTDIACALCGAGDFLKMLCDQLGIKPGETTQDGLITVEETTCLAGCDKAPLFQVQGNGMIRYHEKQTIQSALALIEEMKTAGRGDQR